MGELQIGLPSKSIKTPRTPMDPRQQRWIELRELIVAAKAEMKNLVEDMKTGVCEVCGTSFTRAKVTKQYCSETCTKRAWLRRCERFDIELIASALPAIKAAGLVSPRNIALAESLIATGNQSLVADRANITRERVGQIMKYLEKLARIVQAAREPQQVSA